VVLGALFAEETSVSWYGLGLRIEWVGELEILGGRRNYGIVGDLGGLLPLFIPLWLCHSVDLEETGCAY